MGSKKGRRIRKINVPTDTPTEFELGDTTADIQRRREEARERKEEAQKQRKEARKEETTHSAEEGMAEKRERTDKTDIEMNTEAEGEADTSQEGAHNTHLPDRLK